MKDVRITIFPNIGETTNPNTLSLYDAFERIKGNKGGTKPKIEAIRSAPTKEERNNQKKQLPCVLFSGEFRETEIINEQTGEITVSARHDKSLAKHSGLVVLDWDDIEPQELRPKLKEDPYILACWVSPSGNGLKALVKITDTDKHHAHYRSILSVFNKKYKKFGELDKSNINPSRVCYESYDPLIYVNWDSWIYGGILEERKEKKEGSSSIGIISTFDYNMLTVPAKMIRNAASGDRNNTLIRAARTMGGFVASGYIPADLAKEVLRKEYNLVNPEEPEKDRERAIDNGFDFGLKDPLLDREKVYQEALQEINERELNFLADMDFESIQLMKWWKGEREETWSTGFTELDKHWLWKRPNLIIHSGADNIGKSYTAAYFAIQAAVMHGWQSIFFAIEDPVKWMLRDMMGFAAGKRVKGGGEIMTEREFAFYKEFVMSHITFIEPSGQNVPQLLEECERIMARKSINNIFIDPWNSMVQQGDGNVYAHDRKWGPHILNFSHKRNVNIWINMHTISSARRTVHDSGEFAGLPKFPSRYDVELGGFWNNKADAFIVGHRYTSHPVVSERFKTYLQVGKIKDSETGGAPHGQDDSFCMHLRDMSSFECTKTGETGFTPIKMNISEI